jgi:KipI family sensor histidine kinase inhibitor
MEPAQLAAASDHSLAVRFSEEVSIEAHRLVLRLCILLQGAPELLNIHPGYVSLLLSFDARQVGHGRVEELVRAALAQAESVPLPAPRRVEVPVHYGGEYGPDLDEVARLHDITAGEVVRIHTSAEYLVYFLGFSPGFPYLGGMPRQIETPRLPIPRKHVPAGSVAIGGEHSGIYPVASPGGWRIIGRTPLEIFRAGREPPVLIQMGDYVRFRAID